MLDTLDITYYVNYLFEVGTEHLVQRQYRQMKFHNYLDMDVHLAFMCLVAFSFWLVWRVFKYILHLMFC